MFLVQWKRIEYGGEDIMMNSILYLRSGILLTLLKSGSWSGADMYGVL